MVIGKKTEVGEVDPYEQALAAALDDLAQAHQRIGHAADELRSAEARVAELSELARNLLAVLPAHRFAAYAKQLDELRVAPPPTNRGGPVFGNVIELFTQGKQREWSAAEVQAALEKQGSGTDPKAVYNVLNYLVRKGNLRRVSRGQYVILDLGIGIQLDHDFDGVDKQGGGCMED